ncbi:DUF2642 domain-containing protein [Paenibacillus humicus]
MSFRHQAKELVGTSVRIETTSGRVLTGRLTSVGSDFLVMHVRIGRRIRRINIRLAEIIFLFSLLAI